MDKMNMILSILEENIVTSTKSLEENLDVLDILLGEEVCFDFENRIITELRLSPETENFKSAVNEVFKFLNQLQLNRNMIIFMLYSQMEGITYSTIKESNKIDKYKIYREKNTWKHGVGELKFMVDYLEHLGKLSLTNKEHKLINFINGDFRLKRNVITHQIYEIVTHENVLSFMKENKYINLSLVLRKFYYEILDEINKLFNITYDFFEILKKCN